eukprot:CAMPEP_0119122522 /NCGR_PEP_ID=MMETSP1310-20130426/2751_1 /TAXON_ID=464262 /ORGANISM="Genus nov. species nov., Strain RCC2339" /LENGTH=855 /DNA_ID=CAMNT_0007112187 /DNA_START=44 /DNA_END=2608 /DNA_ORIENTATION=-
MAERERDLLPGVAHPRQYDVRLEPDLAAYTFKGEVDVTIDTKEAVTELTLHCLDIAIGRCSLRVPGEPEEREAVATTFDASKETVTFRFATTVPVAEGLVLRVSYTGCLNDKMKGFYRSAYEADGSQKIMAVTQFEATDARRALPCWDEPSYKAVFVVTLVVEDGLTALSNMPVASEAMVGGKRVVKFEPSPLMSTYLLAFLVGDMSYVATSTPDGVDVRVYTQRGKESQGKFALEVAVKAIPYYNDYFGISYPLPKMDLVAIPDFAAGAMENWGLVTYRETALLVDPAASSSFTMQWVAIVVAHEIAHQWFGNLVTMEWWSDLWLNEGFASWIEYLLVDHLFPEWHMWDEYAVDHFAAALRLDAMRSSHPIEVPVYSAAEIDEIFDSISYCKGSAVIRMLAAYLGGDTFASALNFYLTRHQYGNATTEDLWKALGEHTGMPVKELMDTWTKQMGYPFVHAVLQGPQRLRCSQERFLAAPGIRDEDSRWFVPLTVVVGVTGRPAVELRADLRERDVFIDLPEDWTYVKVNPRCEGFYRVRYEPALVARLLPLVGAGTLPPVDRLSIQSDAAAFANSGVMPVDTLLDIVSAYAGETNFNVWSSLSASLLGLEALLEDTPGHDLFQRWVVQLLGQIRDRIQWDPVEGESLVESKLRSLILGILIRCNDQAAITTACARVTSFLATGEGLSTDLRSMAYRAAVRHCPDRTAYDALLARARSSDLQEEKMRCYMALGTSRDPNLLRETLELAKSDEVRSQDAVSVIAAVGRNRFGRHMAWEYLKANWDVFTKKYESGSLLIGLVSVCTRFATEQMANEVEAFLTVHPVPTLDRVREQSVERIRLADARIGHIAGPCYAW